MKKYITKQFIWFVITVLAFSVWLFMRKNSINTVGDTLDLWKTITTWGTENVYGSYVLYKGLFSVYPYVWLYRLAGFFGLRETAFIIIYHALLFAYITAYGLPSLASYLTKRPVALWQRVLLTFVCFFAWRENLALTEMLIDLPSAAFFLIALNSINRQNADWVRKTALNAACTGIFCGIGLCLSGQYIPAIFCILLYAVLRYRRVYKGSLRRALTVCSIVSLSILLVYFANHMFNRTVVDVLRENGAWIPKGSDWMSRAFVYLNTKYLLFGNPTMENSRYVAMLVDFFGKETAMDLINRATQGVYGWSINQYLYMIGHYPLDMIAQFFSKLFISLSPDNDNRSALMLLTSYTLLYITFHSAVRQLKTIRQFFQKELLITLAFLATLIAPLVMTIEMRYALSIQGFVYAMAICGGSLERMAGQIAQTFKEIKRAKSLKVVMDRDFPWGFAIYLLFIVVCFSFIAVLYETAEPGSNILFTLF